MAKVMEQIELHQLIDKYLKGAATEKEALRLMQWYRQQLQDDVVWEVDSADEEERVKAWISDRIQDEIEIDAGGNEVKKRRISWRFSAAAVLIAVMGILWWLYSNESRLLGMSKTALVNIADDALENRFVMLPDSSKVILRPGSSLTYKTDFKGKTREVVLTGEGYFDIHRDELKPFIVYAGEVKTVVLGTAFTIKADEEHTDVLVTVQRGKVRVERQEKVLAELVVNQQLEVNAQTAATEQKEVVAEDELAWTSADLRFDSRSFGMLAESLSRRYGTMITFKNPNLKNCPATGRFKGTETLEEVLNDLCSLRNATYKKLENGVWEIDGKGCSVN